MVVSSRDPVTVRQRQLVQGNRTREKRLDTNIDYEAPALLVIGTVKALTHELCLYGKSHGKPDYLGHMHPHTITNCSS